MWWFVTLILYLHAYAVQCRNEGRTNICPPSSHLQAVPLWSDASTIMKWVTPSNHSMSRAYQFNAWPEWSENLCQPSRILTNELIYSCSPQPAIQLNRKEEYSVLEYCCPPWRLFKKIPFPRFDKLTLSTRKTEFILLLWWDIYYTILFSTDDRSSCRND